MLEPLKDLIAGKRPVGAKRSSQWPKVRAFHLSLHPVCELCGSSEKVEVHHIVSFHVDPALELSLENLITLCESKRVGIDCHRAFGHLGNYKKSNPRVSEDVAYMKLRFAKP